MQARCKPAYIPAMATLSQIAGEAGVSEATVSRVLNSKPGRQRGHATVGDHRARRPGLRAADAPAAAQRRPRGPGRARAGEPDLPGLRAGHRGRAGTPPVHPGALHPVARQPLGGRVRRVAPRPRRRGDHLRLRQARRHPGRPRALPDAARPGAAGRLRQRVRRRGAGAVRVGRRPGRDGHRRGPPRPPRSPPHRSGDRSVEVHAVGSQARGLRRRARYAPGAARRPRLARGSPRPSSPSRGARPPPSSCSSRAPRPSSAAPT